MIMKLLCFAAALFSASALHAQNLGVGDSRCAPAGMAPFGDISMMHINASEFKSLPCLATLNTVASLNGASRGVTNYGNIGIGANRLNAPIGREASNDGDLGVGTLREEISLSEEIGRQSVLSVYASEPTRLQLSNLDPHRSNFFAVNLSDDRQLQIALESIDGRYYVSSYILDASWQERLVGRVLRDTRASDVYGIHLYRKQGLIESVAIVQDAAKTVWRLNEKASSSWEWRYGMLLGGTGDSVSTDNWLPVKLYLNTGLRPWVE
jgi:hypothetical protein